MPGLHISLGIFDRLWELLESACVELDLEFAEHNSGGTFGEAFANYSSALKESIKLTSELNS